MIQRGRKSAAARSIASLALEQGSRPEPLSNLDEDEAKVWREVVARMPAGWFGRETHGLLQQYCKHEASLGFIDKVMQDIKRCPAPDLVEWRKMARERRLESKMVTFLATKMRLTQQACYDKTTAWTAKKKANEQEAREPWQRN
jgi:hypothetical protein